MIRRFVGLLALTALLGPASCLDDGGPPAFSTEGTCYPGDTIFCDECPGGELGLRVCNESGHYDECTCPGCTSFPDCDKCGGNCFEGCMCQTAHKSEADCRETCEDVDHDAATD